MPSAQELLAARARRVTAIRRRVIAATLASFVLFWGAVAWDGSMGAEASTTAQTTRDRDDDVDRIDRHRTRTNPRTNDDGSSLSTSQS